MQHATEITSSKTKTAHAQNRHKELKRFKVRVKGRGDDYWSSCIAISVSQAKYKFFLEMEFENPFKEVMSCFQVRRDGELYQTSEEFKLNAVYRGIEFAYCGMRVEVAGKPGVIIGHNSSANLDVLFDGWDALSNCHPWWKMKYFDKEGNLIADYTVDRAVPWQDYKLKAA
jgi:hypothetical protein